MSTFFSPYVTEHFRREWWWSQVPFWQYLSNGAGWANLVDKHPGMFNLAWALSGGQLPPQHYQEWATTTAWVLTESGHMPMKGRTVADAAFYLPLQDFTAAFLKDPLVRRWRFLNPGVTFDTLAAGLKHVASIKHA